MGTGSLVILLIDLHNPHKWGSRKQSRARERQGGVRENVKKERQKGKPRETEKKENEFGDVLYYLCPSN